MVIFELPAAGDRGDLRAMSLGSCRVKNPLFVLRDRGDLRIRAEGPSPTHTVAEALQSLTVVLGERSIPESLTPYIYEGDHRPSLNRLAGTIRHGIDVFIIEISDDKQFIYNDICLNQNFVSRNLVQAHRGALLDWYREICRGRPAEESSVRAAMNKLDTEGFSYGAPMAALLRGLKLERRDGEEIAQNLGDLVAKMGGRWIVVGPFAIPGDEGDIMQRRRAFNESLRDGAGRCGALFYDPSQLILAYGKETALAGGGADIYEYAETFYSTVGETLVRLVRAVGPPRRQLPEPRGQHGSSAVAALPRIGRSGWVIRLEAKMGKSAQITRRYARKLGRWIGRRLRQPLKKR
ncbi:MAG: hypothetical protein M3T55_07215 [Pseudomonadota bacterium]|nr:hypothetical protein [Pseudomonadota bacterium]